MQSLCEEEVQRGRENAGLFEGEISYVFFWGGAVHSIVITSPFSLFISWSSSNPFPNPDANAPFFPSHTKWMPDPRDKDDVESASLGAADSDRSCHYPCLRCHSTIDAPLDRVCSFLANPDTVPLYNELIDDHRDVEVISPSSKITWCKVPKILFVKPRDFVTYCSHRWLRDGTQVIVNQACEHEDVPGVLMEG